VIVSRTLLGSDVAQYAPGMYAVNVTVVSKTTTVVAWGGDVRLPLSSIAPLPPGDGPLTGTWIQPNIDTWIQLDLSQSGASVVGYQRTGFASGGGFMSAPIAVTGSAGLRQATLQWSDGAEQVTMYATISANGDSLTGTWSHSGQATVPFRRFLRSR
jgi:hypothetical protein